MLRKLFKDNKDDRGNALVSSLFIFPLLIVMLITTVDFSMYLNNRAQIQGVARDGARTVAIMGGNGNATQGTPIEKQYGQSRASACNAVSGSKAFNSSSTAIECNMIASLDNHKGLVNVDVTGVKCSPTQANFIGQRVACEVRWVYGGMPASMLSMLQGSSGNSEGLRGVSVTAGSSESEVNLNGVTLVSR